MQTVKQLAEELGVSKTAVMKCIKRLGVELQKDANRIVIDDVTAETIRQEFAKNRKPIANQQSQTDNCKPTTANHAESAEQSVFDDVLGTENRKPTANQNANRQPETENQSQTANHTDAYIKQLLERIDGLEQDKKDLKAEKEQMQKRIDEKDAHIMEISARLTVLLGQEQIGAMEKQQLVAAQEPEQPEEKVVQPEPEPQQPEKKKGFWARLFGK